MEVRLTAAEMHICRLLAKKMARKKHNKKMVKRYSDELANLIGLYGEMAFSKVSGVPMDTRYYKGGDGGFDFLIAGEKYQIKTRNTAEYSEPDLLVRSTNLKCDWYVLCWWHPNAPNIVDIKGHCDWDRLSQRIKDLGYGDSFLVKHQELEDPAWLTKYIRRKLNPEKEAEYSRWAKS